ncbi:hypothetical protein [Thiohalobacter thiocyanaticus]|uniref:DUF3108 domain-containing protein n=1 Tax=Thiohalobacter thiocyanaticus TaxID=585455 RepID=A0A426QH02_9GAMM|nr:hypothetical protein [Thiohalobacter thiocyanaticus]RRQ21031.1 hypothetical protein D6C00_02990 [Thiohalobacter thiocyanaticus]
MAGGEPVAHSPATALPVVGWQAVTLSASNLLGSAVSRIRLHEAAAGEPAGQVNAGGPLLVLLADNRVGRQNLERLSAWYDPAGTLVQRCRVGFGRSDSRAKCYRYEDRGILRERRESDLTAADIASQPDWTRDGARSALALARDWPVSSSGRLRLPDAIPENAGLISPTLLLPLASAAPLQASGDSKAFFVHTDHDFFRVTLTVTGREPVAAEYRLDTDTGSQQIRNRIEALVIRLETTPIGDPENGFELLGLRPPLTLLLDPATRLPLALRGDAPRLGPGEIRLEAARLSE